MILLSDANVLMDLGFVGGLRLLPLLGRTEVLSTVLLECHHTNQPTLVTEIASAGIVTVQVERPLMEAADAHPNTLLSLQDRQCLIHARDNGRVLLSGDAQLRSAATEEGIRCHGSVWLVEQAHQLGHVPVTDLCRWLSDWPLRQRRLPKVDLIRLRQLLNCPASEL